MHIAEIGEVLKVNLINHLLQITVSLFGADGKVY